MVRIGWSAASSSSVSLRLTAATTGVEAPPGIATVEVGLTYAPVWAQPLTHTPRIKTTAQRMARPSSSITSFSRFVILSLVCELICADSRIQSRGPECRNAQIIRCTLWAEGQSTSIQLTLGPEPDQLQVTKGVRKWCMFNRFPLNRLEATVGRAISTFSMVFRRL